MTQVSPGPGTSPAADRPGARPAGRRLPDQGRPDGVDTAHDPGEPTDYDGGLRATAEGGRVAVFRGSGDRHAARATDRQGQQQARRPGCPASPEIDSPFLGLFPGDAASTAVPGNGAGGQQAPGHVAPHDPQRAAMDRPANARAPEDLPAPQRSPNGLVSRLRGAQAAGEAATRTAPAPQTAAPAPQTAAPAPQTAAPAPQAAAPAPQAAPAPPQVAAPAPPAGNSQRAATPPAATPPATTPQAPPPPVPPVPPAFQQHAQFAPPPAWARSSTGAQPVVAPAFGPAPVAQGAGPQEIGQRPGAAQPGAHAPAPAPAPAAPAAGAPAAGAPAAGRKRRGGGKDHALESGAAGRTARSATPARRARRTPLERTPKPRHRDRAPAMELAINEIAGHLTFTPSTVTAWYSLPEVRWAFRPDAEREALLAAISEQYAGLAGFRLHLRRTTRPFQADQWARTMDINSPHPLPPVPGGGSWSDHLVAAQQHLLAVNHAEGQTYLGVTFARRTLGDTLAERFGALFKRGVADAERRRMARAVEQFDEVLGAFGMRGRRVTVDELEWLLYRSVALCMRPPTHLSTVGHGVWDRGDLLALTEQIERYRTPYGSTLKLVNRATGEEGHVAVLAVGRMEPLEIPERHEPWLHFHERLPWPMEISSRVDVLGPNDSFRNLEHRLRLIRSQQKDYAEHGIDAPPELERLAKRALTIGDQITTGLPVDSSRAHGWHRIAVGGETREECLERARRLIKLYSRDMRISLQHPKNQDWLAREFIPGEPLANTGYLRRMPVKLFAAALPQAASTVGDRRGDLIGRTAGTCRRPVFLDLHFPMEVRERSGLAVFVAEPGGGKSTLLGALGYLAARRGVQVTLLDPSGPLARLCAMPELAPYSRVLNLTGSEQGTLAPYSLIPTPLREHYADGPTGDREFDIAVSNARAERRMLVQDIAMMLVPPQVAREASTATMLRHAVRQVPAEESSTLDHVVKALQDSDDPDGVELGNLLLDTAEMPLAMLFFGSPHESLLGADAALTVITMAGLRLPDLKIEREYWSAEESLALPMLHTAHRLAVRRCYGGDMARRKLVGLDEAHFMEGWRSGRSFLVRLARDSRKWNLAALVASQNPKDILGLDVQNLVSTVFVGRIAEDSEIAAEALRLLRVPTDVGYEQTLASLSQVDTSSATRLGFREFVMRDVDGRVQKMRADVSYVPELLRYLDTTPAAVGPAPVQRDRDDDHEPEV